MHPAIGTAAAQMQLGGLMSFCQAKCVCTQARTVHELATTLCQWHHCQTLKFTQPNEHIVPMAGCVLYWTLQPASMQNEVSATKLMVSVYQY